jgi:hypothetical protein
MNKLFKLALTATGIIMGSAAFAQTATPATKEAPAAPAATMAQDTTKKDKAAPANSTATEQEKKEDSKAAPAPGAGSGGAGNGTGGTRMAINEQGVPSKKGPKKSANAVAPIEPDKKKSEK